MLEDVGFNLDYVATDYATYTVETELREGSSYDMFLSSWIADFGDSASMMDAFFGGVDSPIPAFYVNEEYQAASSAAKTRRRWTNASLAFRRWRTSSGRIAAALFLYFPIENYGVAENLEGFEARVDGFFDSMTPTGLTR